MLGVLSPNLSGETHVEVCSSSEENGEYVDTRQVETEV